MASVHITLVKKVWVTRLRCRIVIKTVLVLKIVMAIILITSFVIYSINNKKVIPIVLNNNNTYGSDSTNVNTIKLVTRQCHSLWSIWWNTLFCFSIVINSLVYCIIQYVYDLIMMLAPKSYLTPIIRAQSTVST